MPRACRGAWQTDNSRNRSCSSRGGRDREWTTSAPRVALHASGDLGRIEPRPDDVGTLETGVGQTDERLVDNGKPGFHEQLELRHILEHVGAEGRTVIGAGQTSSLKQYA